MKINVHSMPLLSLAALLSSCAAESNDKSPKQTICLP